MWYAPREAYDLDGQKDHPNSVFVSSQEKGGARIRPYYERRRVLERVFLAFTVKD